MWPSPIVYAAEVTSSRICKQAGASFQHSAMSSWRRPFLPGCVGLPAERIRAEPWAIQSAGR
eukprot:12982306-Alexandrium_andersonii.AAC.1